MSPRPITDGKHQQCFMALGSMAPFQPDNPTAFLVAYHDKDELIRVELAFQSYRKVCMWYRCNNLYITVRDIHCLIYTWGKRKSPLE